MRALIVDDEKPARDRLRAMLADHPDVTVVGESGSAAEAIRAIRAERPDLVFLDVQMPGRDGFHVTESIEGGPAPFFVFVTAHAEHAVKAFDRAAGDYLLKPYDDRRLARAVARARAAIAERAAPSAAELRALLERLAPTAHRDRIAVTAGKRTVLVDVTAIEWIEARDNYVCLHVDGRQHLLRETLGALEATLDPRQFVRIHRSAIVRLDRIREIRHLGLGDRAVVMQDGTELPVSQTYRDRLPS